MKIPESIKTYGVALILIVAAFWLAARYMEPPPPRELTLAAGTKGGAYYAYAELYKASLVKPGIHINILETSGALENIELLRTGKADFAFVQSGLATIKNKAELESLGSLYFEPLWVFLRKGFKASELRDMKDMTLAIGKKGSGTRAVTETLLAKNGVTPDNTTFLPLDSTDIQTALEKKKIDAAFIVAGYSAPLIQTLLRQKDLTLMSIERAGAYTRIYPFLSKVYLPKGVLDLSANIPAQETQLISPAATLIAHKDIHPALKALLVQTAFSVHKMVNEGVGSPFGSKESFPSLSFTDFPISAEAQRYHKHGPSLLQRYLPFWLADIVDRLKIMLIPLLTVLIPLIKIAPPSYRWRVRSRIYKWYKSLKKTEEQARQGDTDLQEMLDTLDRIDSEAKNTTVPLSYTDELYNLRLHIQLVRNRMQKP